MWGFELAEQNREFLFGIDPSFFNASVEAQLPLLSGPTGQHAAMSVRMIYGHALETFFALLMAAIQAPHCPLGWILRYQPGELAQIVRKVDSGAPLLTRTKFENKWHGLALAINLFHHDDSAEEHRIMALFGDTWALLAEDYLDSTGNAEYNSIKHGMRVKPGGFWFKMESPDGGAPIIDSKSAFGSRFFSVKKLGKGGINFHGEDTARNWSPVSLAVRTELLSVSIGNVVSFLLTKIGGVSSVRFNWSEKEDNLDLAWKSDFLLRSMSGGYPVNVDRKDLLTKDDILAAYSTE
jgi:hypothetical protein